jgi:hypothetical protein
MHLSHENYNCCGECCFELGSASPDSVPSPLLLSPSMVHVQCVAEKVRGKKDWLNGFLGGGAAGAVLGVRAGRLGTAIGAAAALAAASAAVDASGGKLTGQRIADGATPPRRIFPYES